MSISYQLPTQSRFISTSTIFSASFNAITPGMYDFTQTTGNQNVVVIDMQPNTIYFIDRLSVGGNITEEQYLEAVNNFPLLYIKRKIRNENVYQKPIPISGYYDGNEISTWVISDKGTDQLLFTFEGVLRQTAQLVGIGDIKIQMSLNIFAVESSYYAGAFRDQQARSIGQVNRS